MKKLILLLAVMFSCVMYSCNQKGETTTEEQVDSTLVVDTAQADSTVTE